MTGKKGDIFVMKHKKPEKRRVKAGDVCNYALFIGPTMILFTLLFLIPLVSEIFYSFTNWNGIDPTFKFMGIKNYIRAVRDGTYWTSCLLYTSYNNRSYLLCIQSCCNGRVLPEQQLYFLPISTTGNKYQIRN